MNSRQLLNRAQRNGAHLQCTCVGIGTHEWDELMKGATRANKKDITRIALIAGVIDEEQARTEIARPYYNPYRHYKTNTHAIYVHSGIEHFILIG